MLHFPSHHRCGDQFVQQNSSEGAPAPHPAFPAPLKSSTPSQPFSTQIQCNSHAVETSSCADPAPLQSKPACLNDRKQEERAQSQLLPLPNQQSLRDLHRFSSFHEPPDTDPGFIQALWNEVIHIGNAHKPPKNQLGINIMGSSVVEGYEPRGFSSTAFPEVLKRHQITIKEDVVVPSDLVTSFWLRVRQAVGAAPAEVISELESCKVWGNNDESTKANAEANAEDLAAKMKAFIADPDSALFDHQQFITGQILHSCLLPGVRVFNNPKMLDVKTEPYHLISARESSTSSISRQPIPRKLTRPTTSIAPSTITSGATSHRSASQNAAQPTKIDPITLSKLGLPKDVIDCAYWLEASELHPLGATWIARQTFVSNGTNNRKTSPYLSIAFENLECGTFAEKRLLVKHKIAVYGSTALYNRHLLYATALKIGRSGGSSITQVERSIGRLHFGLVLIDEEATLYVFQREENLSKTDQAAAWQGCNMSKVGEWTLTAPNEVADMLYHLRIVADWVRRVYMPVLHDDLNQLSNNHGH